MTQQIQDFLTPSCRLLAFGEPTHQEPAFGWVRNTLLDQLTGHGFRSIAVESDRVAGLLVDDYVQHRTGDLDTVLRDGFSHGLGALETNRELVVWMRAYNANRPPAERLAFHGFDAPTEMMSAPSPRTYLEHARDYLGLDLDLAGLAGDDERWSRTEAILDAAESIGATAEADRLNSLGGDLLTALYARAPELIAATSRDAWDRARIHLTAGLALLRYHRQCAQPGLDQGERVSRLSGVRDAIMAQNLLDIRDLEAGCGGTLVFAHNQHLQRNQSIWQLADMEVVWSCAGAVVSALVGEQYTFVAGSLGHSDAIGLGEPAPDTYEGALRDRFSQWGLLPATTIAPARTRTDTTPPQGYFPLDQALVDSADAVLHIP